MELIIFWVINILIYWALVRAVVLLTPRLEVYKMTHQMDKNEIIIFEAIVRLVERIKDYLLRHKEDFNTYQFADVFYKMLYAEVGIGVQDRILAEVGDPYSGKLRWGVFDTPENKIERINTTVGWDSKEYVGFQYGFRF